MKFISSVVLASFLALQVHSMPAAPHGSNSTEHVAEQTCGDPTVPVALLRAYNPTATSHFYTTNYLEMEHAVGSLGFDSEGDAAFVFPQQAMYTTPMYRLYSPSALDHLYTTNAAERDNALKGAYNVDEGITAYVYMSNICGSVPLYRMYNPRITDHFYTTSASEKDNAITHLQYVYEGIAAYVFPQWYQVVA